MLCLKPTTNAITGNLFRNKSSSTFALKKNWKLGVFLAKIPNQIKDIYKLKMKNNWCLLSNCFRIV